jgi:hypothetical protein
MKYVLDVSVAICWVIPRPLTPKADRLRDEAGRCRILSCEFLAYFGAGYGIIHRSGCIIHKTALEEM